MHVKIQIGYGLALAKALCLLRRSNMYIARKARKSRLIAGLSINMRVGKDLLSLHRLR